MIEVIELETSTLELRNNVIFIQNLDVIGYKDSRRQKATACLSQTQRNSGIARSAPFSVVERV